VTRTHAAHDTENSLPYRRLAVRVIDQALRDAADPTQSTSDRLSARLFLAGSSMLRLWCEVASLNPRWMAARARALAIDAPCGSSSRKRS
jgi:hypothetical protein